jgi:hypothetical protein
MSDPVARFHAAVSALAGHGHIKQRLIKAYEDNLSEICEDDLPTPVRQAFTDLRQQMYRVAPLNGEGPVCASVRKMSIEEASECAVSLVSLYAGIMRHGSHGQALLPLGPEDRRAVPPFLVKSS